MKPRKLIVPLAALGGLAGWYLFRPELLFVDRRVNETLPVTAAEASAPLLAGVFHSNAHETRGRVTVHRLADGGLALRLAEFATSNGPDVRVYLVAAPDVTDDETPARAGFVDLGPLKGNVGDQNYTIPGGTDLSRFRAVSIWCRRFSVNFGAAPLS